MFLIVATSPRGHVPATVGDDQTIKIWTLDPLGKKSLNTIKGDSAAALHARAQGSHLIRTERARIMIGMTIRGRVHNGVVVLEDGVSLPEGATVRVSCGAGPVIHVSPVRKAVELPLVKTGRPGTVALTNDRIAEILDEQDAST